MGLEPPRRTDGHVVLTSVGRVVAALRGSRISARVARPETGPVGFGCDKAGAAQVENETRALVTAAAAFVLTAAAGLFYFAGDTILISGRGSAGDVAAIAAAAFAGGAFAIGYAISYVIPAAHLATRRRRTVDIFDLSALVLAHATVVLLVWAVVFSVVQQAFDGAALHPVAASLLTALAVATSSYFAYLSGVHMTTSRLSMLLLVFLIGGVLTSMLTARDPRWWESNISALGITADVSGLAFNFTLAVAGIILTTLAAYATRDLVPVPADRVRPSHDIHAVKWTLIVIGIFLSLVGLFPANRSLVVHNAAATGMVVTFAALIIALHWLIPEFPTVFTILGYTFLFIIAVSVVLWFPIGYYGLTAVELIVSSLIFVWLVVFVRVLAASRADTRDASRPAIIGT